MKLIRLEHHQHPRPPHHELRQKNVLDSADRQIGEVANLYVDENDRELHFVDVVTGGVLGLRKKHHLVPVEAISEEDPGAVTLEVDQQTVERAPTLANPHAGPDEELQRATRVAMDALFRDANGGSCNILALASIKDARVPALGNGGTLNRGGSPYSPLR